METLQTLPSNPYSTAIPCCRVFGLLIVIGPFQSLTVQYSHGKQVQDPPSACFWLQERCRCRCRSPHRSGVEPGDGEMARWPIPTRTCKIPRAQNGIWRRDLAGQPSAPLPKGDPTAAMRTCRPQPPLQRRLISSPSALMQRLRLAVCRGGSDIICCADRAFCCAIEIARGPFSSSLSTVVQTPAGTGACGYARGLERAAR